MTEFNPARPTWLEISRSALSNNVQQIRKLLKPTTLLTGVVKGNAYGHGALPTSHILVDAGIDRFAVASLNEALELRAGGIDLPILVLGYTPGSLALDAVTHDVTLAVVNVETTQAVAAAARALGKRAKTHLKVNTGMNRLGVSPNEAQPLLQAMAQIEGVEVEGIFTHFATSDTDRDFAEVQFARFTALLDELSAAGLRPPIAHAANSAATLTMPHTQLDMVRCGITLYGLDPDVDDTPLPPGFVPALSWKTQVAQVRRLQPGDAVSYGREFIADHPMTVATLPVGYADGFPRRPFTWRSVLIHGQPAPILGRVCMDQCVVDVTEISAKEDVQEGSEVVLIGRQRGAEISAAEAGQRIGTINYDVVCRLMTRIPRYVVEDDIQGSLGEQVHNVSRVV